MLNKSFTITLLMLLLSLCAVAAIYSRPVPVVVQTNLEKLPMEIAGYSATEDSFSDTVYRVLNADKYIYRHYQDRRGNQIDLYIGYYGTAKGGRTGHNPYACLPGGGSAIIDTKKVFLRQSTTGRAVPVNYILSRKDGMNTIMLHWYQTAGSKVVSTGLAQNINRFVGRLLHNRNDGAFVRLTAQAPENQVAETLLNVENFAGEILMLLPGYWPVEK